jgi:hypothetical protein
VSIGDDESTGAEYSDEYDDDEMKNDDDVVSNVFCMIDEPNGEEIYDCDDDAIHYGDAVLNVFCMNDEIHCDDGYDEMQNDDVLEIWNGDCYCDDDV